MSATVIEILFYLFGAAVMVVTLRSDDTMAKRVVAVILGTIWAYMILNGTDHFLESVVPFMHGALRVNDFPWPWWLQPWW